ncbi:hypothetical protein AUP68_06235 [Ilyonectria robusta]
MSANNGRQGLTMTCNSNTDKFWSQRQTTSDSCTYFLHLPGRNVNMAMSFGSQCSTSVNPTMRSHGWNIELLTAPDGVPLSSWLKKRKENGTPLSAGPDDVLPPGRYYFCIEGEDQYPVVPNFDHFVCPDTLPPPYASAPILSSTGDDAVRRDRTCRITASSRPNETAHIIPSAQSDWWQRNRMSILYTGNAERGLDRSAENTILLRSDLHKMWDDNKFAIVPKAEKWAVHVLWHSPIVEIQERYHNLELQPLADVSRHFFLCRFAMAVFSKGVFLTQKVPTKLVFVGGNGSNHVRVQNMAVDEYQQFCMTSTRASSRSQSPKKRQRSAAGDLVDDGYTTEESEETGDDDIVRRVDVSLNYLTFVTVHMDSLWQTWQGHACSISGHAKGLGQVTKLRVLGPITVCDSKREHWFTVDKGDSKFEIEAIHRWEGEYYATYSCNK